MIIPAEAFDEILSELESRPIPINRYRKLAGDGRSQAFLITGRRCLPPDYSRLCWLRPKLLFHLLDFADKYVDISYNAITVNQNYKSIAHKDKHNIGNSLLVSFGDFTGGDLKIHETDLSGNHDIRHKPMIADFSKMLHSTEDWSGNRCSLVFYQYYLPNKPVNLPKPSVRYEDGIYKFYRGDEYIDAKIGIFHNLKGRKKISKLNTDLSNNILENAGKNL
jgi:hypothetical protein